MSADLRKLASEVVKICISLEVAELCIREGVKNLFTESVRKGGTPSPYGINLSTNKVYGLVGYPPPPFTARN